MMLDTSLAMAMLYKIWSLLDQNVEILGPVDIVAYFYLAFGGIGMITKMSLVDHRLCESSGRFAQYANLFDATSQKAHRKKKKSSLWHQNHVRKTSITCISTVLLLFHLLPTAAAVDSDDDDGSAVVAAAAATVAAAVAATATGVAITNRSEDVREDRDVTPPTLRVIPVEGGGEENITLPLPKDETKHNYTQIEVIEMSITYKKQDVLKAIEKWGKDMKARFNCGNKVQQYGPGSTKMKTFFPKKQSDPYPEHIVEELLRDLVPGSEAWRTRVELIVGCECHASDKAGIYRRHNVHLRVDDNEDREIISSQTGPRLNQVTCVTPENSEATTPGGSMGQAFTFSQSPQPVQQNTHVNTSGDVREDRDVTPPTLRVIPVEGGGEENITLPLPKDETKHNYTQIEVIEMSITYKKQDVLKAIEKWGKDMKARFNCGNKVQQYGPGSTKMKTFFPKKQSDPYPEHIVEELLRGLVPGSEAWRTRVELIVGCECHAPDKAGIYRRHNVHLRVDDNEDREIISSQTGPRLNQVTCVTPENSEATTPGGSMGQAFTFSQSPQPVPTSADQQNTHVSTYCNGNQWTSDEEAFVKLLVREFKEGIIPITPGTAVTDFLVQTLHCSRQRISRKFGKDLGIKQMKPFQRSPFWMSLPYSDMAAKVTALRDSEEAFMKSKFDDLRKQRPASIFGSIPAGIDKCDTSSETNDTFHGSMLVNLVKANHEFCTAITDTDVGFVGNLKRWPIIWSVLAAYKKNESDRTEAAATMPSRIETEEEEDGTTILNNFDCLKDYANSLDFDAVPRKTRDGGRTITLHDKKLPTADLRSLLIYFSCRVMREMGLDSSMETEVEELLAKILFYDFGYKSVKGYSMESWSNKLDCAFLNGLTADDKPLQGNYKGKKSLVDSIESTEPGMVRKLFRLAQEKLTAQASFEELAGEMTEIAASDEIGNKEWNFSAYIVRTWFNKIGGKLKSSKAKPFLTADQKKGRVKWMFEQKKKIESVAKALEAEAIAEEFLSDEEASASEWDEELYGPECLNLNETHTGCAAGHHCCMPRASLSPVGRCRTCIHCKRDMHGICGEVFDDFLASDFEIKVDSLSEEALNYYMDEEREEDENIAICLKCCEELTVEEYKTDGGDFYAAFLDEKWFYTDSLRRKIKELPPLPGETPPPKPKCISRRNAVKVMFLGVVAKPIPDKDFDGKILLERVCKVETYKRMTCNQNFTDNAPVNEALKNGDWKKHVQEGMTLQTLRTAIQEEYNLDDFITARLVIYYKISLGDGKEKPVYVNAATSTVPSGASLEIGDYKLKVQYKQGDERVVDTSCNSEFMLNVMPKVGKAIRAAYWWVSIYWPIFLYLDNAGGHGTKEAVQEYVEFLRKEYNVICVHQRPRSPETNMLDLGVWMALQSVVEKMHRSKRYLATALSRTVNSAWEKLEPAKLSAVYDRWVKVLDLVILDNGGNDQVESRRGQLFSSPTSEVEGNEQALDIPNGSAAEGMTAEQDEFFDEQEEIFEEEIELDDHNSGCCAGRHCMKPGMPVATAHKCLNCRKYVHGFCLIEWDQLSLNGYDISQISLTEDGQKYLDEKHTYNDICLRCIEEPNN